MLSSEQGGGAVGRRDRTPPEGRGGGCRQPQGQEHWEDWVSGCTAGAGHPPGQKPQPIGLSSSELGNDDLPCCDAGQDREL